MANELQAIQGIRQAMLARKLRRKAALESLLLLAVAAGALYFTPGLKLALILTLAVVALGLPLFILRRGQDLRQLTESANWRQKALEGRGISLADWHKGTELPTWTDRH